MVTTRRGKSGEVKINYDGYVSSSSLPKKLDMMNLKQFAVYQQKYLLIWEIHFLIILKIHLF